MPLCAVLSPHCRSLVLPPSFGTHGCGPPCLIGGERGEDIALVCVGATAGDGCGTGAGARAGVNIAGCGAL